MSLMKGIQLQVQHETPSFANIYPDILLVQVQQNMVHCDA